MGEAANEAEARLMIEAQQRGSVTWNERSLRICPSAEVEPEGQLEVECGP